MSSQQEMSVAAKTATVRARTAASETPVKRKTMPSSKGQTGRAAAGLKSPGDVPVAEQEVADGGVAVPAFIGVFGPVFPRGLVGKIRLQVNPVQSEEDRRRDQEGEVGNAP